ncbi:RING-H2 finger protein ATL46 [Platanthera zijinensis]|uniref:RING-type E3 ubiquitin transferase n=1 Tax=Platanthera zijinensis TaxID=2320716 RepID=A0AAP0C1L2_9ASPA
MPGLPSQIHAFQKDSLPLSSIPSPASSSSPSGGTRISPAVLFIIVILAVIFFVSGLLHLLVRFLIKKGPPASRRSGRVPAASAAGDSDALQRQLQQLFHLHDSGLDQAFIDALPVFLYREIVGAKEPFDCAVCLCEFSDDDKLRLLPICGHAFHLHCIDTWLLSNSTCPLCRGALFVQGLAIENPMFDFDDLREDDECSNREDKAAESEEISTEKRVFPVRLGKFKSASNGVGGGSRKIDGSDDVVLRAEEGETSSSNLDARRCFSMGSYHYVVPEANLQVALSSGVKRWGGEGRSSRARLGSAWNSAAEAGATEGKRLHAGSKGESFSVSKIWLWPNRKGKLPISAASNLEGGLPWMVGRSSGDS